MLFWWSDLADPCSPAWVKIRILTDIYQERLKSNMLHVKVGVQVEFQILTIRKKSEISYCLSGFVCLQANS